MIDPILLVEGLSVGFDHQQGRIQAVDNVSFALAAGERFGLAGESGSGKSTLARVVTGLLPRIAGDVRFNGVSLPPRLKDRTRDQLRRVQMIYQMPDVALNPQQTLLDVIGRPVAFYFNRSRDEVHARVLELLRQMDLPEGFITRKTSELSGGQKQRLALAFDFRLRRPRRRKVPQASREQPAMRQAHFRNREFDRKGTPVGAHALDLDAPVEHSRLTGAQVTREPLYVPLAQCGRHDQLGNRSAYGVGAPVAEGFLRRRVELDDVTGLIDCDDAVERRGDDSSIQCLAGGPRLQLLGQITLGLP